MPMFSFKDFEKGERIYSSDGKYIAAVSIYQLISDIWWRCFLIKICSRAEHCNNNIDK